MRCYRVGGKKYIVQILSLQRSLQPSYRESNIGKITELSMDLPSWCTTLVHQYGGRKGLREEKQISQPKS